MRRSGCAERGAERDGLAASRGERGGLAISRSGLAICTGDGERGARRRLRIARVCGRISLQRRAIRI